MTDDINQLFPDRRETGETKLRQCQLVMLRMLRILDHICAKHQINYWMTAGTLIGAIRHRGFVPWDCDIDVGMTVDDVKRLKTLRKDFPEDMFFQDSDTDPKYPKGVMISKLRDRYSNYVTMQENNPKMSWQNGLQIDLIMYAENKQEKLINPFRDTEYEKNEIFPCVRIEFEGTLLMAPRCYDSYLRKRYGNYMHPPPPNKRFSHEGVAEPMTHCPHPESLPYPGIKQFDETH